MRVWNLSFLSKYKIQLVIGLAVVIATILILFSFSSVLKLPLENILEPKDIFNCKSYYAEYEITEISNKNRNIYVMNETYKKENDNEFFKFGYKDVMGNDVTYIVTNDKVKIENSTQLNSYILNSNNFKKTNLFSLATYVNIINNIDSSECKCFILNISEEDDVKKFEIILNKKGCTLCKEDCKCKHSDLFSDGLKIGKLELLVSDNKPLDITVYGLDNNAYINVKYTRFELNNEVSSDIFKF